jgi:uncharacterized membrane protein
MSRAATLWAVLALAAGVVAAFAVAAFVPSPGAWAVALPPWLARALGDETQSQAILTHPAALWLMPLAVLPFLVVVVSRSLVDLPRWQLGAQLVARLAVLMAVALALTQPSLHNPIRGKSVVMVVDVSDSIDDTQRAGARELLAQAFRRTVTEEEEGLDRADRTRLSVVTYAGRPRVFAIESEADIDRALARPDDGGLASDHAAALRLAAALVDPQTEGRIMLVSDGLGSLAEREDLRAAADELHAQGLTLHTRFIPGVARGDVLVDAVHLPDELRVGETFEVRIDVVATQPGRVAVDLFRDGEPNPLEPRQELDLVAGTRQIRMKARVKEAGPVVFSARLDTSSLSVADNRTPKNDEAAVAGQVRGRPQVLLAGGTSGSALARALRSDHLDVTPSGGTDLPQTWEAYRAYDLVIFDDLGAGRVPTAARDALVEYVTDHGGGFIMIGGENSYGVGGWKGTTIERILPVTFEGERQREQPKLALVLVIDKSGSMSSEDKLDLVKEAARATAQTLDPTDELGVIAFDSRPHVLVRLQPAANRIRIAGDIRRLSSGGGTNALPALRESYLQLAGSNAMVKHVILLSDGQSPEAGIDALLSDMRDGDITVSAVGVGAGAGKDLLRRVASRGRGRFYYSHDGTDVPRIFSRETREVTRNAVQERSLLPRVAKNVQLLRGIDFAQAPGLRGIVPVDAKKMTEVILRTQDGDELLVRGRRGLGRTAAFASDAKNRWAARWLTWSGYPKFFSQLARDTMRQGASLLGGAEIAITNGTDEGAFRVVVDVEAPEGFANDLAGEIEVVDPAIAEDAPGRTVTLPLHLSAPGRYEAEIRDVRSGQRLVTAKLYDDTQTPRRLAAEAVEQVSVPYPAELSPSQLSPDPEQVAALASGTAEGPLDDVLTTPGDPKGRTRVRALWPEVLWALLLPLLLLDLLLRRIALGSRRLET